MYYIRYSSLFLLLVVAFGRITHQLPAAADTQPRPHSQYVQRQKSDTSDIVAGNSKPLVGQVTIIYLFIYLHSNQMTSHNKTYMSDN